MKSTTCLILLIGILFQTLLQVRATDYEQKSSDDGDESSANYQFQYAVNEGSSGNGNDFGHEEERNGKTTRGRYQVLLPDGRLQVVTYRADETGYHAEVTYENTGGGGGGGSGYSAEPPKPQNAYIPPPSPPQNQNQGYSSGNGASKSYGKRNSGSFVKLRRKINGRNFNYSF